MRATGYRLPGRPIAAKVAMRPIGYRRNGRAIWPISGRADIALVAEQHFGSADDANTTTDPLVLDKDSGAWASLAAGTVVVVVVNWRTQITAPAVSVSTTGGQTWNEDHDGLNNLNNAIYSCVFNGTWTADPAFDLGGTATGGIGWATAWSNVDSAIWDVAPVVTARSTASSFTEATWNTATDGAMAFVGGGTADNNTWSVNNGFGAPSGSGNIYWRNAAGADSSLVLTTKLITTAGAVGATTITQATLGNDAGYSWHAALKPAAGGPVEHERAASFDATADIATAPQRDLHRQSALDAVADIASTPQRDLHRVASLEATADIAVSGESFSVFERSASLDATATLDASGQTTKDRAASLDATAEIQAAPRRDLLRQASLDAQASLEVAHDRELHRQASLDATADVSVAHERELLRQVSLDAIAAFEMGHERELLRQVALDAIADLIVSGEISGVTSRQASFDAEALIEVGRQVEAERAVSIDAIADVSSVGSKVVSRSVSFDATAEIASAGVRSLDRQVSFDADAVLEVGHVRELERSVSFDAEADIAAAASIEGLITRSVSFEAVASIEVSGFVFNPTEDWDLPPPQDQWPVSTRQGWTTSVGTQWPMPR